MRALCAVIMALALVASAPPSASGQTLQPVSVTAGRGEGPGNRIYRAPVDAPVTDPFRPPPEPWSPGNRGIEYATVPGTPVRAIGPGAVVFASGQSSADIVITPVDDALFEGAETLILSITDTGSYDVGTNGTATVTIADNEVNNPPTAIALTNAVSYLSESASTASDVLIAGISVTDDGNGTNSLSLSGADAASFTITGTSLYLKAGTTLSFATKPDYAVTVNVDDTTVGTTPDASTSFTLNITKFISPGTIVITEVSPWSSTNTQSSLAADWFEVTNRGTSPVDITGWKIDDNSHAIGTAVALNGITTIAPGESVIFIESATSLATTFNSIWFGGSPPAGLQIGSYTGSGIGLGSTADEVTLFDRSGLIVTGVGFGASPTTSPFGTFDNAANVGSNTLPFPVLTTLSTVGTNGAFQVTDSGTAAGKNLIGSPGATATSTFAFASATYSVVESAGSVTLTITWRSGRSAGSASSRSTKPCSSSAPAASTSAS